MAILPQKAMPELCFSTQMTRIAILSARGHMDEVEAELARNQTVIMEQGYLFLLSNFVMQGYHPYSHFAFLSPSDPIL